MLLLGGQHPADPAGNHGAAPARILARHIQPRIPYGLIGRGHCKLCKAVHMPELFFVDGLLRVEVPDLGSQAGLEI